MKTGRYQRRLYRDWVKDRDLYSTYIAAKETDIAVFTDRPPDKDFIKERIRLYRLDIENYIDKDKRFLTALKPLGVELRAPEIVKKMAACAKKANVGPMAAVAGAIAEFLGRDLLRKGCKDVIIENGGDIFLKTTRARVVGIYAGRAKLWNRLGLKINPSDTPLGICASSGTLGHSLSFGRADIAVILSKSASLADAAATAVCNRIRSKKDLQTALDFAKSIKGVSGAVLIIKRHLAAWGRIEFAG